MSKEIDEILAERQELYGDAKYNFERIGRIWGALLNIPDIPAWQVALLFDGAKSIRCIANPNHKDSWQDKIGYTKHGQESV